MGLIQDFLAVFTEVERDGSDAVTAYRCRQFFVEHGAALKAQLAPVVSGFGLQPLRREGGAADELGQRAEAIAATPWSYSSSHITGVISELLAERMADHEKVRREERQKAGEANRKLHRRLQLMEGLWIGKLQRARAAVVFYRDMACEKREVEAEEMTAVAAREGFDAALDLMAAAHGDYWYDRQWIDSIRNDPNWRDVQAMLRDRPLVAPSPSGALSDALKLEPIKIFVDEVSAGPALGTVMPHWINRMMKKAADLKGVVK